MSRRINNRCNQLVKKGPTSKIIKTQQSGKKPTNKTASLIKKRVLTLTRFKIKAEQSNFKAIK